VINCSSRSTCQPVLIIVTAVSTGWLLVSTYVPDGWSSGILWRGWVCNLKISYHIISCALNFLAQVGTRASQSTPRFAKLVLDTLARWVVKEADRGVRLGLLGASALTQQCAGAQSWEQLVSGALAWVDRWCIHHVCLQLQVASRHETPQQLNNSDCGIFMLTCFHYASCGR
jgi:hypothetical protein